MDMNMKRVTRTEMNRLMAVPEIRQIVEAKLAELRLVFKERLRESGKMESEPDGASLNSDSNIILFPMPDNNNIEDMGNRQGKEGKPPAQRRKGNLIKIVDASGYKETSEEEQVNIFMDYFEHHKTIRRAVLDEFFLRILPYSDISIENG